MTPELAAAAVWLADTLAAENRALSALDLGRAAALLGDKERAVAAFEAARLLAARQAPGARPGDRRAEAEALAARLRDLGAENRRLLERAIGVQGQVIATVARALPARPGGPSYGASGAATRGRRQPALALAARA